MRATRWGLTAALAALAAGSAGATTVAVTITGLPNTEYELEVSGLRKTGRLGAAAGPATVHDLVDVGARGEVTATVTFTGSDGVLAACPGVSVKVEGARQACEPMFVLSGGRPGEEGFTCKTTCDRTRVEKSRSHDEDEDDDEDWVYACAEKRGDTAKSHAFYSGSMSERAAANVYSAAGNGTL